VKPKFKKDANQVLSDEEKRRYLRNTILPEIGDEGQRKLMLSRCLVIGAGGLGSSAILYLASAGIGNIGIVDDDVVELSNLQRQVIHNEKNLGEKKIESAKEKILLLNKNINVEVFDIRASVDTLGKIVQRYDIVLDSTDNFYSRFLINETCHKLRKPLIFAAVKGFSGQISVFKSYKKNAKNPCYACFNGNFVDESFSLPLSEKGILGSVAGSVGAIQATSAIKEILNIGESLVGKILVFDFLKNEFRKVILKKNPKCKTCG
jgi:adenylyltransferase/sulfurtransferase